MKAITLRNVPGKVAHAIEAKAREMHASLNRAVVMLLEERLGLGEVKKHGRIYHDLDHLIGAWSKEEADEFDKALREQRKIDPELWR